jgi:gas vesicle protein
MASNGEKTVVALVLGLAVGYATGILTAPKSGAETRQDIKDAAEKFKKEAVIKLAVVRDDLDHVIDVAQAKADELSGKARKEIEELLDKAKVAQAKSKDVLLAVKNGESDDKDLDKAVSDVKDAKNHLKNFLKRV